MLNDDGTYQILSHQSDAIKSLVRRSAHTFSAYPPDSENAFVLAKFQAALWVILGLLALHMWKLLSTASTTCDASWLFATLHCGVATTCGIACFRIGSG